MYVYLFKISGMDFVIISHHVHSGFYVSYLLDTYLTITCQINALSLQHHKDFIYFWEVEHHCSCRIRTDLEIEGILRTRLSKPGYQ